MYPLYRYFYALFQLPQPHHNDSQTQQTTQGVNLWGCLLFETVVRNPEQIPTAQKSSLPSAYSSNWVVFSYLPLQSFQPFAEKQVPQPCGY